MNHRHLVVLLVLVCFLIVFGCSDDSTDPAGGGNDGTGDYLKTLPTWAEFSPPLDPVDVDTDTSTACLEKIKEGAE